MSTYSSHASTLTKQGFTTLVNIYSIKEVNELVKILESLNTNDTNFRKTKDLFAIRQFLIAVPEIQHMVLNDALKRLIHELFGADFFLVKSLYFDKPSNSNWFVSYHQDLSISVDNKVMIDGYNNWTVKKDQFGVQPPLDILQNIYTVRIHLDDTNSKNGALKVIPASHSKGIYRPETIN
ncbi:phytanoyl-CoA dioxygenase family protein [Aquimarina sp. 2201CG14-23]|uniref:phytanoyl-CoA dioxygenase family protein n=1 Tax=Aquimarina mycalae TaxID=3040073 RepID=UPI0032AF7919